MTRQEVTERFNALPREIRTTIIGVELSSEISYLKRQRKAAIDAHAKNLQQIDKRIKVLEQSLNVLEDD